MLENNIDYLTGKSFCKKAMIFGSTMNSKTVNFLLETIKCGEPDINKILNTDKGFVMAYILISAYNVKLLQDGKLKDNITLAYLQKDFKFKNEDKEMEM